MKIGVVSDTHISREEKAIPSQILNSLKQMDMILHCGDLVRLSVLDELKSVCGNVKAVRGNMDSRDVKECLPEKQIISVGKYKIGLTHGRGAPRELVKTVSDIFKNDEVDIIVFGHSHFPLNEKRGKILYFNPGSLCDTIFAPFNSYGIIEINDEITANIIKI
jgi:putative phosphoesterase